MTKQKEKPQPKVYPTYTARDFFELESELEKLAVDKEQTIKGKKVMVHFVPTEGIQKWYINNGGLSDKPDWTICDIPKYEELQNKMEQYNKWQGRRTYAIKKELEGYEELAKSININ